jgi:hypothetical protein
MCSLILLLFGTFFRFLLSTGSLPLFLGYRSFYEHDSCVGWPLMGDDLSVYLQEMSFCVPWGVTHGLGESKVKVVVDHPLPAFHGRGLMILVLRVGRHVWVKLCTPQG